MEAAPRGGGGVGGGIRQQQQPPPQQPQPSQQQQQQAPTELQRTAALRAAEAERLEAVLRLAAKSNQSLLEEDWELM